LFNREHHGANAGPIMTPDAKELPLLNRLFEEAVCRHGCDLGNVVRDVEAQIAALSGAEQDAIQRVLALMLAFREPRPGGALH
jgi:hypothetical protein